MQVHSINGLKMKFKKGSNSSIRFKVERIKRRKQFKQKQCSRSCGIRRSFSTTSSSTTSSSTTSSSGAFSGSISSDSSCSTSVSSRSVCHSRKIRKSAYSDHMNKSSDSDVTVHSQGSNNNQQNWKFVCPTCNKRYPISEYLKNHMKSHVKEECSSDDPFLRIGRIARKENSAYAKLASTSADLWTHKCEVCHRLFTTKEYLEQHIEARGHKKTSRMDKDTADKSICKTNLNKMELSVSSSSSDDDDDELDQKLLNQPISFPELAPEFKCSACPIISAFASSIELIDHLQTFHVHSQSTPLNSPAQQVDMPLETALLLPTANNICDLNAHLNSSFHSSFSNVNNQNIDSYFYQGKLLAPLTVTTYEGEPSQAANLNLLFGHEPIMINKDPILWQYVSEMNDQEDLFN